MVSDGNIVILAEGTAFKVHKGVLAKHSEVLEGLLDSDLPQPVDAEQYYDDSSGCPILHISEGAVDAALFLEALYGGPQ